MRKKLIDFYKKNVHYILLGLIAAIIVMVVLWPNKYETPKAIKAQIEALEAEKKALVRERDALQQAIASNNAIISNNKPIEKRLDDFLDNQSLILKQIRSKYENLNRYNSFTTDSIIRFYSRNYGSETFR